MKNLFVKSSMLLITASLFITSCKDKEIDPNIQSVTDNANAQSAFDDMGKVTEDAITNYSVKRTSASVAFACVTVSRIDHKADSVEYILEFPGGYCNDGKVRSGTITAVLDGATYNTPGAVLTITTTNYSVNGNKLEGKKIETCISGNVHTIRVSDASGSGYAKITHVDGKVSQWKSDRTRTLSAGETTPLNFADNVYDISATPNVGNPVASGINREGVAYIVDIISPIRIDFNCFSNNTARYPTQGAFQITPTGQDGLTIDYGMGACDNAVQIDYKGKTYDRTLNY